MHEDGRQHRLFTVADVFRMVEVGILEEGEHVELLDGELFRMNAQGPVHSALTVVAHEILVEAYGSQGHLRDHTNLPLDDLNMPEPDVAVVRGPARDYLERLPGPKDVLLILEVTVTSHARDRRKIGTYARARIPEYWILDIDARKLIAHRVPKRGDYTRIEHLDETSAATPPGTETSVDVRDLLP